MLVQPQEHVCMSTVPGGMMSPMASAGPAAQGVQDDSEGTGISLQSDLSARCSQPSLSPTWILHASPGDKDVHAIGKAGDVCGQLDGRVEIRRRSWRRNLGICSVHYAQSQASKEDQWASSAVPGHDPGCSAVEGADWVAPAGQICGWLNCKANCTLDQAREYCGTM